MRIQIQLSEETILNLVKIANHERREFRQQAAWIIEQELTQYKQSIETMNPLENVDITSSSISKREFSTVQG